MIEPARFANFVGVSWAVILAPGPDMLYVITRGAAHGRRAGMFSAAGVIFGTLVHTVAAALGLTLLLQTSSVAFLAVKYIGAAYLVYLGISAWRDSGTLRLGEGCRCHVRAVVLAGRAVERVNPQVAIFFLAFLPQFVDKASGHVTLQMIPLGLTFSVMGLAFLLAVAYSSGSIGGWVTRRPEMARAMQRVAGGVLVGLGVRLAGARG